MRIRSGLSLGLAMALVACSDDSTLVESTLSNPIDFSYACEGDGKTVAPQNDESASSLNSTRMCPNLASGKQGALFGVVLNRDPASLAVLQMNPASGERTMLDGDWFKPGYSGIPLAPAPVRVLRAADYSTFYVLSGGAGIVERVTLTGYNNTQLDWSKDTLVTLPGNPSEGAIQGNTLAVVPQRAFELWLYDLSAANPEASLRTIAMPGLVQRVEAMQGDRWLVTFRDFPHLYVLDAEGILIESHSLVPACRNGIDDDGDGFVDNLDAGCLSPEDTDEGPAHSAPRAPLAAGDGYGAVASCSNGIDDDGDGFTDYPEDPSCTSAQDNSEILAVCGDGLDNDRDGLIDEADLGCYGPMDTREFNRITDGPFHPLWIPTDYGNFVYVLNVAQGEIAVFGHSDTGLSRINVNAEDAAIPDLTSVSYGSPNGKVETHRAVQGIRSPALYAQGQQNIALGAKTLTHLSAGQLRGELWERILNSEPGKPAQVALNAASGLWKPSYCDPQVKDTCQQPALDDASWYAFGPDLDGRLQAIEVVRRGVPVHRVAERINDLDLRTHTISTPRLTLLGELVNSRGEIQPGFPFLGAPIDEELVAKVEDLNPAIYRRFGIWPPSNLETSLTESWTLTYEGQIPNTKGYLGVFTSATTFQTGNTAFCEEGVKEGDWLQLEVPVADTAPEFVHQVEVVLANGSVCPTFPIESSFIELPITSVGESSLEVDPTGARLRARLPVLDEDGIREARLAVRACKDAHEALRDRLGLPENLPEANNFDPSQTTSHVAYTVRSRDWIAVGSVSGFVHGNAWNGTQCIERTDLSPLAQARIREQTPAFNKYQQCPPTADQLRASRMDELTDPATRFYNASFGVDVLPGCSVASDGSFQAVPSQQDTMFSFNITAPHDGLTMSVVRSMVLNRVPLLDFRRQQVQLDSAARKASVLQFRIGDPRVIATFE